MIAGLEELPQLPDVPPQLVGVGRGVGAVGLTGSQVQIKTGSGQPRSRKIAELEELSTIRRQHNVRRQRFSLIKDMPV